MKRFFHFLDQFGNFVLYSMSSSSSDKERILDDLDNIEEVCNATRGKAFFFSVLE